jgi:hypothetical protein
MELLETAIVSLLLISNLISEKLEIIIIIIHQIVYASYYFILYTDNKLHLMSSVEQNPNEDIEFSSDSAPEDIDIDDLNEIKVDPSDLDELNTLFATTKLAL